MYDGLLLAAYLLRDVLVDRLMATIDEAARKPMPPVGRAQRLPEGGFERQASGIVARLAILTRRLLSRRCASKLGCPVPVRALTFPCVPLSAIGPGGRRRHHRYPPVSFGLGGEASARVPRETITSHGPSLVLPGATGTNAGY